MATTSKRKKAVAATVAATAILLAGTFAWTSISQQALNESAGVVNVGGRLHDDFNGDNKDVYVENFTNPLEEGSQPVYARIRLDEYMEVGQEAGGTDVDGDGVLEAVPVINGTDREDESTWTPHAPTIACEVCAATGTCTIHEHWTWEMGGQTVFMPTFNKDKDRLDADINGTYHGTNKTDKVYYDDYVEYAVTGGVIVDMNDPAFVKPSGADDATPLTEASGKVTTVEDTAYYDDDTDGNPNDYDTGAGLRQETEKHTAKETQNGTVILMADWIAAGANPGNFWVYDEDGWAYWANPIMPGEATGLLLSGIEMIKNPGEKCYYAINVIGEFATVEDWSKFNDGKGLAEDSNARKVMEAAAASVPTVQVEAEAEYVNVGETYSVTASASRNGIASAAAGDFNWTVADEKGIPVDANIAVLAETENGADLTVKDTVPDGTVLVIGAQSTDENHLGATGTKKIIVKNAKALVPGVTITLDQTKITNIKDISLTADVVHNFAKVENPNLIWTIDAADTVAKVSGSKLEILQKEGEVTFDITASCTMSENTSTDKTTLKLDASDYCDICGEKYGEDGFCASDCSGGYQPAVLTADGDYEVASPGQMFYMAAKVNAGETDSDITLTDDIDLNNQPWTPMGTDTNKYMGTFDGGGNSITGLLVNTTASRQGMFGNVARATIQDVSVSGTINVDGSKAGSDYGFIGRATNQSIIKGVHSAVDIVTDSTDTLDQVTYVGGIVGTITDSEGTTVDQCSFSGSITGKFETAGGIVGYIGYEHKASIKNCLFTGRIAMEETVVRNIVDSTDAVTTYAGGILGYYNAGYETDVSTFTNCLCLGTISIGDDGELGTGAVLGNLRGSTSCTVNNLYYLLSEGSNANLPAYGTGGTTQDRENNEDEAKAVTVEDLKNGTVCSYLNDDGGSTWTQGTAYPKPNQW